MLLPVVAIGLAVAVFFAPDAWKERMDPTGPQVLDGSAQSRLNAWTFARSLAADYPITGGGFETFTPELYARYWPTEIGNIYGPHSVYFQVLAEHGYTGLLIYLSVVVSALLTTRRIRKVTLARGDTAKALYAQMYRLALVGFLVSGLFLGRAYFDYYFTVVASIGILSSIVNEEAAGRARPNAIRAAVA
jgi:probable O-glycosylation ligase (exosortase A-associated)